MSKSAAWGGRRAGAGRPAGGGGPPLDHSNPKMPAELAAAVRAFANRAGLDSLATAYRTAAAAGLTLATADGPRAGPHLADGRVMDGYRPSFPVEFANRVRGHARVQGWALAYTYRRAVEAGLRVLSTVDATDHLRAVAGAAGHRSDGGVHQDGDTQRAVTTVGANGG